MAVTALGQRIETTLGAALAVMLLIDTVRSTIPNRRPRQQHKDSTDAQEDTERRRHGCVAARGEVRNEIDELTRGSVTKLVTDHCSSHVSLSIETC